MRILSILAVLLGGGTLARSAPTPGDPPPPLDELPVCLQECFQYINSERPSHIFDITKVGRRAFCADQRAFFPQWDMEDVLTYADTNCHSRGAHARAERWYVALCGIDASARHGRDL